MCVRRPACALRGAAAKSHRRVQRPARRRPAPQRRQQFRTPRLPRYCLERVVARLLWNSLPSGEPPTESRTIRFQKVSGSSLVCEAFGFQSSLCERLCVRFGSGCVGCLVLSLTQHSAMTAPVSMAVAAPAGVVHSRPSKRIRAKTCPFFAELPAELGTEDSVENQLVYLGTLIRVLPANSIAGGFKGTAAMAKDELVQIARGCLSTVSLLTFWFGDAT